MPLGKIIILSAPSGSGKSTLLSRLLVASEFQPHFSISATSRAPRGKEQDGREYHFLSPKEFEKRIAEGAFIEYEEVYPGTYYGTLRSEIEVPRAEGRNVFLDIDVKGAVRLKEAFGDDAFFIFIKPPTLQELEIRLRGRGTESEEKIQERLARAKEELSYESRADAVVVNDDLEEATESLYQIIKHYLTQE